MKAAVYNGPGKLSITDIEAPVVGPGEALLEVKYCGVCGTDVKTYVRGHHMFTPPCVLGHEVVGRIVELKEPARGVTVREGDLVAVAPYVPCYSCAMCRRDRHELCRTKDWIDGGFAQYLKIPSGVLLKGTFAIPEGMDPKAACLSEPLACCVNAITDTPVRLGDTVLILGAGPMGLLILELCKASGAAVILVSEPDDRRRKFAADRGARVCDPSEKDLKEWVKDATGGVGADTVFVCVGAADAVKEGMSVAGQGGTVNIFGGLPGGAELTVDPRRIHYDEVTLAGSFGFTPEHFKIAMDLIASQRVCVEGIITHEFSIDNAAEALETAASGKALKALIAVNEDA